MELGLANKIVFVAGSTRGIGLAVAEGFVREQANVVITGRVSDDLESAAANLRSIGRSEQILAIRGDMTEPDAVRRATQQAIDRFGRLDVAIANVGRGSGRRGWDASLADWDDALRTNLLGGVALVIEATPHLIASKGTLIFLSSIAGLEALDAPVAYSAAKSAVLVSARMLARSLGPDGVRVNAVAPGNILHHGSTWARKLADQPNEVWDYLAREVPLARFGQPAEIADAVLFLASERAMFINGACLVIDGGQTRSFS